VLRSAEAFDPREPDWERAWRAVRLPPLPRPLAAAAVGLVTPRRWVAPPADTQP
jgi:hypothetical protein